MGTRNDDISLILAKAKKQGFLPDVYDSEVGILSAEADKLFGDDSAIGTPPKLIHYDTFKRVDGDLGTAPSGQVYLTYYTNNQRAKIVNEEMISQPQDGTSTGSGYAALNLDSRPSVLVQRGKIFGSGSGQNSSLSIVIGGKADGSPVTSVTQIIDRCLHLILTRTGISVQYRDAANGAPVSGPSWPLALNRNDGTEFEWQVRYLSADTIEVIDPLGVSRTLTDPRVASLSGRSVYWQAVNMSQATPTPGDETRITGLWTFTGSFKDSPTPEQMKLHPNNPLNIANAVKKITGAPENRLEVYSREANIASGGLADGRVQFTYFTPVIDFTASRIEMYCGSTAATGATLIRMGLYTVANDDSLTLVAATANDTTLFSAANAVSSKGFDTSTGLPASYKLLAGKRYAIGILVVGIGTSTVRGVSGDAVSMALSPGRLNATLTAQADIPNAVSAASLGTSGLRPWARFWSP